MRLLALITGSRGNYVWTFNDLFDPFVFRVQRVYSRTPKNTNRFGKVDFSRFL